MDVGRFSQLIAEYLQPLVPGQTVRTLIEASADPVVRPLDLAQIIKANQSYSQLLRRMDLLQSRIAEWKAEDEKRADMGDVILDRIVSLLGKQATRNAGVCIGLHKLQGTLPKKESDRFNLTPQDQIKSALAAEGFCQEHNLAYSEIAYVAGLHYDWLKAIFVRNKAPKDALTALSAAWTEGFEAARIAYDLSRLVKDFKFDRMVFAAALLEPIGKSLIAALYPKDLAAASWSAFLSDCDKFKTRKEEAFDAFEKVRFDPTYREASALIIQYFGLLSPIEMAVYFSQHPYFLKKANRDLYRLSGIISLARGLQKGCSLDGPKRALLLELKIAEHEVTSLSKEMTLGKKA
jgi:hypothetical protein